MNPFAWDLFISKMADTAGLPLRERQAFRLRFSQCNIEIFQQHRFEKKAFDDARTRFSEELSWDTYENSRKNYLNRFRGRQIEWECEFETSFSELCSQKKPTEMNALLLGVLRQEFVIWKQKEEKLRGIDTKKEDGFSGLPLLASLEKALRTLNYDEQSAVFYKSLKNESPAIAFLIQGNSTGCRRWLLNRLIYAYEPEIGVKLNNPGVNFNKPITPRRTDTTIDEFWPIMSHSISGNYAMTSPEQLVEHVYQRWKSEPVVLVFNDLEKLAGLSQKRELINMFCSPLVKKIKRDSSQDHCLLIFLIDEQMQNRSLTVEVEEQNLNLDDETLVILPFIQNFSLKDIEFWLKGHQYLPNIMADRTSISERAQQVWSESRNGIPIEVMKRICSDCGENWFAIEDTLAFF